MQVIQPLMGTQDMVEKMKLRMIRLCLLSITECYMERKLIEGESEILSPLSFLRSIFIMQSIGFNLTLLMRFCCISAHFFFLDNLSTS